VTTGVGWLGKAEVEGLWPTDGRLLLELGNFLPSSREGFLMAEIGVVVAVLALLKRLFRPLPGSPGRLGSGHVGGDQ